MPTLVATYGNPAISPTSPKTASITTAIGDLLVCYGGTNNAGLTLNTPTGGTGLTWTLRQSVASVTGFCNVYVWTATATTAETFTFSLTGNSSCDFSYAVLRFSNHGGVGASGKQTTAGQESMSLTTTGASSSVVVFLDDFNAIDGTSRTWNSTAGTATETSYLFNSTRMTLYGACYANVGAAGAKSVGLTAPTGQADAIVAVEVLAAAGSSTPITVTETGTGADALQVATPTAPPTPTGLTATAVSSTEIDLSWTAVSTATGYDIQRDGVVIVTNRSGTTYNDTGRSPNTSYSYQVRSRA